MIIDKINTKPNIVKRAFATILDYSVLLFLLYLFAISFGHKDLEKGGYYFNGPIGLVIFLFWPIYIVVIERIYGATLGHRVFNLEVISMANQKLSTWQVIKRRICDPIDILWLFGFIAFLLVKNTQYNQRLGDIWAKTIIVDTKDLTQGVKSKFQLISSSL